MNKNNVIEKIIDHWVFKDPSVSKCTFALKLLASCNKIFTILPNGECKIKNLKVLRNILGIDDNNFIVCMNRAVKHRFIMVVDGHQSEPKKIAFLF